MAAVCAHPGYPHAIAVLTRNGRPSVTRSSFQLAVVDVRADGQN
jgi:hypothetical protein